MFYRFQIISGIILNLFILNRVSAQLVRVYREPMAEYGLSTLLYSHNPLPMDYYNAVLCSNKRLHWSHSGYAIKQTLYIGNNRENVANGKRCSLTESLDGNKSDFLIPDSLPLHYSTKYYWRISSDNGSLGKDSGQIWSFRTVDSLKKNDITFFVCSDNHYGRSDNSSLNKEIISLMNMLPGTTLPDAIGGGIVETPRGVVVNGDLLDDPNSKIGESNWNDFVADFGLNGDDGKLGFPVYEGYGNHDVEGKKDTFTPLGGFSKAGIIERNKRRLGVKNISSNGMHYSWDWDDLHLVQLNLFGGKDTNDVINVAKGPHDPGDAISFLKEDLQKYVGNSKKKVIVFQHFGWIGGMSSWWSDDAKDAFYNVVKTYNIVALINGHSHGAEFIPWKNILTIHDGATARPESGGGDFMVVRLTEHKLVVIQKKKTGWGIMMEKEF